MGQYLMFMKEGGLPFCASNTRTVSRAKDSHVYLEIEFEVGIE